MHHPTIKQNTPFKRIANCIPVKGVKQSTICDLQRNSIKVIPNELFDILNTFEGQNITYIKAYYNNKYDDVIDEYFQFLLDNEFIVFTDTSELFPNLNLNWYEPAEISNAIIDIGEKKAYDYFKVLHELDALFCKHIEFRFFRNTNLDELKDIITFLNTLESSITSVDFNLPYHVNFKENTVYALMNEHLRISSFKFYNAPIHKFSPPQNNQNGYIVYSKTIARNETFCGVIDASLFAINIKNFTESQKRNSCLNKKIAVDVNGNIKNCPSMSKGFGNTNTVTLQNALKQKDFKKYWNITKDTIDICKDCEFRYVCTDCRAYTEDQNNIFSKPLKCGYNPYTNKWSDWSKNPLKQTAILNYGMQELMTTNG